MEQLSSAINQYGLDGLDFDDEYVHAPSNPDCYLGILQGVRSNFPDTLLSMYCIGPAMDYLSYNGMQAGEFLNYAWNPSYGTFRCAST